MLATGLILLVAVVGTATPLAVQGLGTWFEEHPQYSVALPGDSVFFNCKTNSAAADARIQWLHDGRPLRAWDQSYRTPKPGTLSIKVSRERERYEEQLGDYQCITADVGTDSYFSSMPAKLDIAKVASFVPERNKSVEAFVSNDVAIDCNVPESNPPAFVQFYKDGVRVDTSGDDGNARLLNGDTLLLSDVSQENAGRYTCSAYNHITNQRRMSLSHTTLRVKQSTKNEKSRPTYRPKERYRVALGENITIPCIASGNPKPEISWTRLGSNRMLDTEHGCLTVSNAQEIDSGSYMCAMYNGARRFLRRTTLVVLVPPVFTLTPETPSEKVEPGTALFLHCQAMGTPIPDIAWSFNGLPLETYEEGVAASWTVMDNGTLRLTDVQKADEGIYQCFASNDVGIKESTASVLVAGPAENSPILRNEAIDLEHLSLTPPSRPNVTQVSRNSALLTWTLERHQRAMPIQFFKIQYREFLSGGVRSDWKTLDEVIEPRSRSFEVLGLKDGIRYRFRIVAVYANDDNLHGDLSKRFRLDREVYTDRPPRRAPTITQILPLGPRSLRVGWKMSGSVIPGTVEGYFIFIRKGGNSRERKFRKVTIIGHESHSYIFEKLLPGQIYEIKVEAFNFAGSSPTSRVSRKSTLPDTTPVVGNKIEADVGGGDGSEPEANAGVSVVVEQPLNGYDPHAHVNGTTDSNVGSMLPDEKVVLYLIIAGALVGTVIVVVVCCSVLSCTRKKRARKAFSANNVAIHEKYSDTSRHIIATSSSNGGSRHRLTGVGPASASSPLSSRYNSEQQVATMTATTSAETSFSSPNRLSQMLHSNGSSGGGGGGGGSNFVASQPELVSRNPNVLEDEFNSSSELDTSMQEKVELSHPQFSSDYYNNQRIPASIWV